MVISLASAAEAGRRWRGTSLRTVLRQVLLESGYVLTGFPLALAGFFHALVMLPISLATWVVTMAWWVGALTGITSVLMHPALSLTGVNIDVFGVNGRSWPDPARIALMTLAGWLLLVTLPLVTRAGVLIQAGLGRMLLTDLFGLRARISGLERDRDTARSQTVAAVNAEATALRRLERDIHDGPQQRLVRLAMDLGRAEHQFDANPQAARAAVAEAIIQTREALDELRALSRGIAPPILVDRGLRAAVAALAGRCTIPVELDVAEIGRLAATLESAAYFVLAESLTNVAKHSHANECRVGVRLGEGELRVWVTDDGVGGAALNKGQGLVGLLERVSAVGGRLEVLSPADGPTTITAWLPCP